MVKTKHQVIIGDSRRMPEIEDGSVQLMVTSPPYPMIEMWDEQFRKFDGKIGELWQKMEQEKDEGAKEKLITEIYDRMHLNLAEVWRETYRVLSDGGIACINVGDATRKLNGIFRLFPNHARVIELCEQIGFVTLPYILWKKPTNKPNAFLGSGFLPTNGYVTLDMENILIFRKDGTRKFAPKDENRYKSKFTKEERDVWFSQTWSVKGASQKHSDMKRRTGAYPEEIPYRLIRMFSVIGDTVLDPFIGTGTTTKVAMETNRKSIGYEVEPDMEKILKERLGQKAEVQFKRRYHFLKEATKSSASIESPSFFLS